MSISNEYVKVRLTARDSGLNLLATSELNKKVDEYIKHRDELSLAAESSKVKYTLLNTDTLEWDKYADEIITDLDENY